MASSFLGPGGVARPAELDLARLAQRLGAERAAGGDASDERAAKLDQALAALQTAEGTYRQPMLIAQVSYLASMLRGADQRPGRDAYARFEELAAQLAALREQLAR